MMFKKVLFVMPALNEEAHIGKVIREIQKIEVNADVVVINDASTDRTKELAKEMGAFVISLPVRLGYWRALQTGLLYGYHEGYQFFITIDADGQHPPSEIPLVKGPLVDKEADVVIGSCPERGNLQKKLAWSFFRFITGLQIKDLTSGFRGYSRRAVEVLIDVDLTIFDNADIVSLLILKKLGFNIKEVPVKMKGRSGRSRIFHSPFAIMRYLMLSTLISLSKR